MYFYGGAPTPTGAIHPNIVKARTFDSFITDGVVSLTQAEQRIFFQNFFLREIHR